MVSSHIRKRLGHFAPRHLPFLGVSSCLPIVACFHIDLNTDNSSRMLNSWIADSDSPLMNALIQYNIGTRIENFSNLSSFIAVQNAQNNIVKHLSRCLVTSRSHVFVFCSADEINVPHQRSKQRKWSQGLTSITFQTFGDQIVS